MGMLETRVFFPENELGCDEYSNEQSQEIKNEPTIVAVNRGTCQYAQKALNAEKAGALAVILISNSEDVFALPGSMDEPVHIHTAMIRKSGGELLRETQRKTGDLYLSPVPITCDSKGGTACHPFTVIEGEYMENQIRGGRVLSTLDDQYLGDFVASYFGGPFLDSGVYDITFGSPSMGCTSLENAEEVAGKAVVLDRGECRILDKATAAQAAGASALIVVMNGDGTMPRVKQVGLVYENSVADSWEEVERLGDVAAWPSKRSRRVKMLENLLVDNIDEPYRIESIKTHFFKIAGGSEEEYMKIFSRLSKLKDLHDQYLEMDGQEGEKFLEGAVKDFVDNEKTIDASSMSAQSVHDEL